MARMPSQDSNTSAALGIVSLNGASKPPGGAVMIWSAMVTDNFVCFVCRKGFAKPQNFRATAREKPQQKCPDCGGVLWFTGPKYQPPRRDAVRQWALDRALVETGQLARSPRFAYGVPASLKVHSLRELRVLLPKRR
jgi:hypothetical protein